MPHPLRPLQNIGCINLEITYQKVQYLALEQHHHPTGRCAAVTGDAVVRRNLSGFRCGGARLELPQDAPLRGNILLRGADRYIEREDL